MLNREISTFDRVFQSSFISLLYLRISEIVSVLSRSAEELQALKLCLHRYSLVGSRCAAM